MKTMRYPMGKNVMRGGTTLRQRVYMYALEKLSGFIDRELEEHFSNEYAPSSARKRRFELTEDGMLRHMRDRNTGLPVYRFAYGSPHIVWEVVPIAERAKDGA